MKFRSAIFTGVIICFVLSFISQDVFAITAFARKYKFDCTVCHWSVNKLNKTGQDFLRMGHMMSKEEVGDKSLTDYVSLTAKIRYNTYKKDTFEEHAFSLYTGGALDKGFSYFAEMSLPENSGSVHAAAASTDFSDYGRTKLAEAFMQYTYEENDKAFTTVRFGQIVSQLLYIHGVGGRFGKDRSLVLTSTFSGANPYKPFQRNYGAEISQYYKGFTGSFGLLNGTGGKVFNMVDDNSFKDVYGTLDYEFGKEGSMAGFYIYKGKYSGTGITDEFFQLGPMFNYLTPSFTITGMALMGRNKKDALTEKKYQSLGAYLEAGYKAYSDILVPYARYDFFKPDSASNTKTHGPVAGLVWRPFTYGRLVGEFTRLEQHGTAAINKFSLEAQYMF